VFARALGLPGDWAEGTGVILEALREGRRRTIGLGRADDRYFTFCAGVGLDAEVVRRVERARTKGARSTPGLYFRSIAAPYLSALADPHGKQVIRFHDLAGFSLRTARPLAYQVDGDYLGECDKLEFASVAGALRVVC